MRTGGRALLSVLHGHNVIELLQVAVIAGSSPEIYQTIRMNCRSFLSRVRISVRPTKLCLGGRPSHSSLLEQRRCTNISSACHPSSLYVRKDQEAAPKLDGLIQSSTTSIPLASTPSLPSWSLTIYINVRLSVARIRADIKSRKSI